MTLKYLVATVAALAMLGLAGWSCSPQSPVAPKPDAKPDAKSDAAKPDAPPAAASAEKLVPFILAPVPPPTDATTPENIPPAPHLQPYNPNVPPALPNLPEGLVNLALHRPVTSSTKITIIGDVSMVTDGEKSGNQGKFVELAPGLQWIQIDLGEPSTLYAVAIWYYRLQDRVYHDVVIQVSDDADFIDKVQTIFNNDYDNSAGLGVGKDLEFIADMRGKLLPLAGVKGRYIRLYSNGNTSGDVNTYCEVEVWGKPAGR